MADFNTRRYKMVSMTPKRGPLTVQELVSPSPLPETPANRNNFSQQSTRPVTESPMLLKYPSKAGVPTVFHSPSDSSGDTEIEDENLTEDEGGEENEEDEESEEDEGEQDEDDTEDVNSISSAKQTDGHDQAQSSAIKAEPKTWWAYPAKVNGKKPKQRSHTPRRPRNHRALEEGVDRLHAKYKVFDPSKLNLDFHTEAESPPGSGQYSKAAGIPVINRYAHPVNFADHASVTRLNQWRSQIIGRNFPPTAKKREYWLELEKQQILALIAQRYEDHTNIHWKTLTNKFNADNMGAIQPKGSPLLSKENKKAKALQCDRPAPWRTSDSIKHAAFKWSEYEVLQNQRRRKTYQNAESVHDGEDEEEEPESADEEEIPDPHPAPPTYEEAQALRKRKAKEDRIRRKSMASAKKGLVPTPSGLTTASTEQGSSESSSQLAASEEPVSSSGSPITPCPIISSGKRIAEDAVTESVPQVKRTKILAFQPKTAASGSKLAASSKVGKTPDSARTSDHPGSSSKTVKKTTESYTVETTAVKKVIKKTA
ncbi:hypothetical protein GLAREA_11618 [Glarea lozoyensis ATCC 20868]|uniref:Uncharacterized protein n=1 Tax=Glarea lozoyensis (strain ATCC 20868 / MF5171) TaxID=1116229 RepID=S3CEW2_GLAL2|nr:uncharacterized protein GLAREA_11618 [Glarea lozoyensis ATCC 20868]EPE25037.1 hypothetical protein GLAREA_11618 [Glarea lozoyensis ATCC 20868]